MENSTVINLCGNYPENFEKADVLSDPNYVFKNDSSYQAVQLYDNELNSVFVNSFVECEHYVLGGWDNSPTQFNEISYHNSYSIMLVGALVVRFLLKKYFFNKYADT